MRVSIINSSAAHFVSFARATTLLLLTKWTLIVCARFDIPTAYRYIYISGTVTCTLQTCFALLLTTGPKSYATLYYMRTDYLSMRQRYWSDSHICTFRNSLVELVAAYRCIQPFDVHTILTQHIVPFSGTLTHFHYNIFGSMRYGQNVARRKRRHPCRKSGEWIAVEWWMVYSLSLSLSAYESVSIPTLIRCKCRCSVPVCVCAAQYYIKSLRPRTRFSNIFLFFPFAVHLCTLYTYRSRNENIRC